MTAPTPTASALFVSVSVRPPHLMPGESGDGSAWGWTSQNGSPIYGPVPVTAWTTSNPSVARVDAAVYPESEVVFVDCAMEAGS